MTRRGAADSRVRRSADGDGNKWDIKMKNNATVAVIHPLPSGLRDRFASGDLLWLNINEEMQDFLRKNRKERKFSNTGEISEKFAHSALS